MKNINFEFLLGNLSFIILFSIMILYWVQTIFSIIPKFNFVIFLTTLFANVSLLILLILRWLNYGHFPLSNLYESLLFLSWSFTLIELFFIASLFNSNLNNVKWNNVNSIVGNSSMSFNVFFSNTPPAINNTKTLKKQFQDIDVSLIIGTVLSPIALFTNSFATFSLPKNMQKAQALVPALQSNWLMMHVTVMMLSYTALLCGSLLAITFLVVTWHESKNKKKTNSNRAFYSINNEIIPLALQNKASSGNEKFDDITSLQTTTTANLNDQTKLNLLTSVSNQDKKKTILGENLDFIYNQDLPINTLAKTLDNLSYRILGIGFPLLTIGILSGAVWANEAWGSYWSWDPKETWAFITWLIFAIYLHTRITKGWEGKKPAMLASFGFFIVWVCYLGVNILGTGLHSYGWIQSRT